jgi:hypothetical protein
MISHLVFVRKSHRLITVFFHICLMVRSLFHMFFVHRTRLHVWAVNCSPPTRRNAIIVFVFLLSSDIGLVEHQTSSASH